MADATLLGIDIGGTRTRIAVCDPDGHVLAETVEPTAEISAERTVDRLVALANDALGRAGRSGPSSIGVGVTGQISLDGVIDNPFTLESWHGLGLRGLLAERWDAPVVVFNDTDAAALGEYWQGAGRGQSPLFVLTIGTGVGSSLLIDGRVYRGVHGLHPEAGHQVVDPDGPPCYCGARGCLEVIASGPAIARAARNRVETPSGEPRDGRAVAAAADRGDPVALDIFKRVAEALAVALTNIATTLAPSRILIGGGVADSWNLFGDALQRAVDKTNTLLPDSGIKVMRCALGDRAGALGAAYAGSVYAGGEV